MNKEEKKILNIFYSIYNEYILNSKNDNLSFGYHITITNDVNKVIDTLNEGVDISCELEKDIKDNYNLIKKLHFSLFNKGFLEKIGNNIYGISEKGRDFLNETPSDISLTLKYVQLTFVIIVASITILGFINSFLKLY